MSDDLRTRISAVQRQHRLGRSVINDPDYRCECGWRSPEPDRTWMDHPEHVAAAVIRELGLRRQTNDEICLAATKHRYVTRWENGA